jgi:poly [ADP-ribose] polymerase
VEKNINKFYIMQVLQSNDDPNRCYFYTRYGRVGLEGQNSEAGPVKPDEAVLSYNSKM